MSQPDTAIAAHVPEGARDLIWQTFFRDQGRGVSFEAHCPWHDADLTRTVTLSHNGETAAAAIVRPARQGAVAMVGFVCVATPHRGKGFGRILMDACNDLANELGYQQTVLWTQMPEFYAPIGYSEISVDRFLVVEGLHAATVRAREYTRSELSPGSLGVGLPAFATSMSQLRNCGAAVVLCVGERGATVTAALGEWAEVAKLLASASIERWAVNLPADDPAIDALKSVTNVMVDRRGAITMARRTAASAALTYIPLSERI